MFIAVALLTVGTTLFLAFRHWIRYVRFSPKAVARVQKRVAAHIALEEWEKAEHELSLLIAKGIEDKQTLLLHGNVLRGTKRLESALHTFMDGARLYPEELLFRKEEGQVLLDMNQPVEALQAFHVCAPILRNENDLLDVAEAYLRAHCEKECRDLLESLLPHSTNGRAFLLAGDLYSKLRQAHEALAYYHKALETGWNSHQVLTKMGHAYRRLGNLVEAERIFHELLEKDPSDLPATLGLGKCFQERGLFQKALLFYQSSSVWEQSHPKILKSAAFCALRTEKFAYASDYFRQVVETAGPTPKLLSFYAFALEKQHKWQEAEQVYLKQIQLFPSNPAGFRALAWLFGAGLAHTLNEEMGIHYAHVALKLAPDPQIWEILSACHARVGDFAKAHTIQESLLKHTQDPTAKARHSQAMRSLRKHRPLSDSQITCHQVA